MSRQRPLQSVIKAARDAGASRVETPDGYVIILDPQPPTTNDTGDNDFDRLRRKRPTNGKTTP